VSRLSVIKPEPDRPAPRLLRRIRLKVAAFVWDYTVLLGRASVLILLLLILAIIFGSLSKIRRLM
jgi:hypothetical protein